LVDPGYGIAIAVLIGITALLGLMTFLFVHGEAVNYFVAGRSLPLWIVTVSLAVQALDYSSLLGNVDLTYKFSFYDGAVFPIGIGLSLVINGVFLAHRINLDGALTLVDVFAKRYGRVVEILASLATVTCLIMLLAGNLKALGRITAYTWYISEEQGVWASATVTWMYTKCGGLYSVVYTGIFQAAIGWLGCLAMAYWFIAEDQAAPAPSIGFPGYIYPDSFGDGGACDAYNGTKCEYSDQCCYNIALWCPTYPQTRCDRYDRGAYPFGDHQVYTNQMTSPTALAPFPNALLWNWASIFILALGNLAALDFQARCIASDSPRTARLGCIFAGCITLFVGIPFSHLGSITR
jgi:Na+/proline symporter